MALVASCVAAKEYSRRKPWELLQNETQTRSKISNNLVELW